MLNFWTFNPAFSGQACLTELCNKCFSSCKFFSFRYEKYFYGHIIEKDVLRLNEKWGSACCQKMQHHIPEDPNLQRHCSDSLKSHRRSLFPDEQNYLQQAKVKQLTFIHIFFFFWWSIYSSQGAQKNLCHLHNQVTPFKHSSFTKTHGILARKRQRNVTLLHSVQNNLNSENWNRLSFGQWSHNIQLFLTGSR